MKFIFFLITLKTAALRCEHAQYTVHVLNNPLSLLSGISEMLKLKF